MSAELVNAIDILDQILAGCQKSASKSYAWGLVGWIKSSQVEKALAVVVEKGVMDVVCPMGNKAIEFYAPMFAAVTLGIANAACGTTVDITDQLRRLPNNVILDPIYHYMVYSVLTAYRSRLGYPVYMAVYNAVQIPLRAMGMALGVVGGAVALVRARL